VDKQREAKYDRLRRAIGDTPFVQLTGIDVPNQCEIYVKEEYRNPTGSHYDREMWSLLRALERDRQIIPGRTWMLETTTGNSGAAFAWLCRALDYPAPLIVIPEDMPHARRAQIESYGAELVMSAAGQYITGVSNTFGRTLSRYLRSRDVKTKPWSPKHWQDETHSVQAMAELGEEILHDAEKKHVEFDYFVLALGNGASARGIGNVLADRDITLIGMEPAESPVVAEFLGKSERKGGSRQHGIIGTGPFLESQIYPNMREGAKLLSEIMHPNTAECAAMRTRLMDDAVQHVGMSSAGCVLAAIDYIRKYDVRRRCFGMIFYDAAWKYL